MRIVTVKVDDELKRRMDLIEINWSEYIREAIRKRVELEERRVAIGSLLEDLGEGRGKVPRGFINETIREARVRR